MATKKTAETKVGVQKTVSKASTDVVTAAAQKAAAAADTKEAAKKEAVKTEAAKETTAKEETAKKAAAQAKTTAAAAKKADEAKTAEKKTAQKKAPAAKKPAAKKEIKVKTYVQYMGREVEEKDMIAAVKKSWTKASGKKVGDIKSIDLYVKPEEGAVYYVVNGTDTGSVAY